MKNLHSPRRTSTTALALALATLAGCAPLPTTTAGAGPTACGQLDAAVQGVAGARLTAIHMVADDGKGTPTHCQVQGVARERTGADGRPYAIGFEMRLPVDWNQRFLHQVNGGNDGKVVPATGALPIWHQSALARGFAVISSDSGHSEDHPSVKDGALAKGNLFGQDPQARRDYGYTANDTVYQVAQALMRAHYGQAPQRNYMAGCSNGGRHGLVAASRYGDRYDGILAGAPGMNLPKAAVQHAWDVQSWQMADQDIRQAFTPADMKLVGQHVLDRCDALDGLKDGIVSNLAACQPKVDLKALQCTGAKSATCLSSTQVIALNRSLAGPRNSKGEALYTDWSWDAGMGSGNWRFWKLESPIPPWDKLPLIATMGAGSLSYIFTTPGTATPGKPADLLAFLTRFDFDRDAPKIFTTSGEFKESAMAFMTAPDVDNPQLKAFRAKGGKLIVYHGHSDAVFSVNDTRRWASQLQANGGGDSLRYFGVPGMAHCSGGPSADQFDALGALVNWVEKGDAPKDLVAAVSPANKEVPADWSPKRTRLLCPHPQVARYVGGDAESAQSFRCQAP